MKAIDINGRRLGEGPCFIIAEAGVNHNGEMALARQLVDIAADGGADAVKFQTFKAEKLASATAPKADYQKLTTAEDESQVELLKKLALTREMHLELIAHCKERGILFLSTPFEEESADELVALGLKLLKLPSGELTNLPFLRHVAATNLPVLLSTGMASLEEVDQAMKVFRAVGNEKVVLLHCVSNYPAAAADCNLRAMRTMETAFGVPVGYSDHTSGIEVALAAVALGACVVEKHFTIDRNLPGPDHRASIEPDELAALVRGIRTVESALGDGRKRPVPNETQTAQVARKSIISRFQIGAGELISDEMLTMKRPGTGLPSAMLAQVIGRRARKVIAPDTMISLEMLE